MALMSDYEPSALLTKLPEIREQLGILEASLVPDTDNSYIPDTSHDTDDDLVQSTSSISLGIIVDGEVRRKSPLSGTASTSDSGRNGKRSATKSKSSTTRSKSSATRSTGTTPLSETEGEDGEEGEGYLDELELLGELFPTV
jgi:hypothetical protein